MCSRDPPFLLTCLSETSGNSPCMQNDHHLSRANLNEGAAEDEILPTPGGRLKFFKDGKFILELSHRREGERATWIPVPKKTFWPPAGTPPTKNESIASLSISDDNSSVLSSPWQRERCWKQLNPRRNISSELSFYYRKNTKVFKIHSKLISCKTRQPFNKNFFSIASNYSNMQRIQRKVSSNSTTSKNLMIIIEKLSRLLDLNVVSPRKRILRELERVSLKDQSSKRRATPQPTKHTVQTCNSSKQLSSYSITSILGENHSSSESDSGFLRNLLKTHDYSAYKNQDLTQSYSPIAQFHPDYASSSSPQHPLHAMPMIPPNSYRTSPFCWMHLSNPVHYAQPLPLCTSPVQPGLGSGSSSNHHYKDYGEHSQATSSDMPLNLSKNAS